MAKYEPTSTERQLFEENDALRLKLVSKDQTIERLKAEIDQLELKIYELGVANRDLETEVRNLKRAAPRQIDRRESGEAEAQPPAPRFRPSTAMCVPYSEL